MLIWGFGVTKGTNYRNPGVRILPRQGQIKSDRDVEREKFEGQEIHTDLERNSKKSGRNLR